MGLGEVMDGRGKQPGKSVFRTEQNGLVKREEQQGSII